MTSSKLTVDASKSLTSDRITIGDFTLEVVEGPHAGESLHLNKEMFRIGREDWCDLSLPDDPWISTVHCECHFEEKGLRVCDLNSRNGIKIDGVPVVDAYFLPGAKLEVGLSALQLQSHKKTKDLSIPFHDETGTLVGKSIAMRKIFTLLPRLGQRKVTTMITGETGTGKTSIAQAIHNQTHNNDDAPFVVVNCGALPPSLIESALFGHEVGAFTGANKLQKGFFEQANGGTLFLDEVAELPLEMQPKLLDVLERRKIRRLGSDKEYEVDFHLITATHKDLAELCKAGEFREDLFFRLSVMKLWVPPLREHLEDLPLLVETFLEELSPEQTVYLEGSALRKMKEHLWPGNLRELRNVLERSLIFLEDDTIKAADIELQESGEGSPLSDLDEQRKWVEETFPTLPLGEHDPPLSLKELLKEAECFYIAQALKETNDNAPAAAKLLTLSESWLYSRARLYGLTTRRRY